MVPLSLEPDVPRNEAICTCANVSMYTPPSIKPHPKTPNQRTWMAHEPTPQLSDSMVQPGGGEEADGAGVRVAADGPAAADSDARQPTVEADGSETAASATSRGVRQGAREQGQRIVLHHTQ